MKIAIDALGIHYSGGGRSATFNLLKALFALDPHNEYLVLLTQPEPDLHCPSANVRQLIAPVKNRFAVRLWAQLVFPPLLRGYDLVHFMKDLSVFGLPTRSIVTVYDLSTVLFPQFFPALDVWYWRNIQGKLLQRCDRIVAISP